MAAIKITSANFDEIINGDKPVLLDFFASWCGPCKMLSPIIEEIAAEREDYAIGKIDVDAEPELASRFNVFSIPTLVHMKNGEIISQIAGARPKAAILAKLDNQ